MILFDNSVKVISKESTTEKSVQIIRFLPMVEMTKAIITQSLPRTWQL